MTGFYSFGILIGMLWLVSTTIEPSASLPQGEHPQRKPLQPNGPENGDEREYMQQLGMTQVDNVDYCIFTCDTCYKGEALLKCANECIITSGFEMGFHWASSCPALLQFHRIKDYTKRLFHHHEEKK